MADNSRIYLVGFMGAGKTSVGQELAARLSWTFIDLDADIERSERVAVREIFRQSGEPHFRQLEREHLKRLSVLDNVVIALGGGAYVDPENRSVVDTTGMSVWLKVSLANVFTRVTMDGTRPLFAGSGATERLYAERTPFYTMAQLHVSTDNRSPREIADEIADQARRNSP